jgi:DNA-binding NtrC family response regulator
VDGFTNPEEAIQSFKSNANNFCVVVSDVRMPELSGIQTSKEIKRGESSRKVVLMTALR